MCKCQASKHARASPRLNLATKAIRNGDHLVQPVIMLKEMVLDYSGIGEFISLNALTESQPLWQGKRLALYHTETNVGHLENPQIIGTKLHAEAWLSLERANADLIEIFEEGIRIDVSTGYSASVREQSGKHDGKDYSYVQENIAPDHLALLPNARGRCSNEDGCGLSRTNNAFITVIASGIKYQIVSNSASEAVLQVLRINPKLTITDIY